MPFKEFLGKLALITGIRCAMAERKRRREDFREDPPPAAAAEPAAGGAAGGVGSSVVAAVEIDGKTVRYKKTVRYNLSTLGQRERAKYMHLQRERDREKPDGGA